MFLEDLPVRLAAIKDAVTGRNADALRAAAHALKGAAGNLSAGGLFEAARVLERIGAESRMDAAEAAWRQLSVEASQRHRRAAPPRRVSQGAILVRILIADDDRMSTMMLGRTLEQWGFEVVVAHDGAAAWERIAGDEPPALAIVDWMMPGIDGIELCRRIRATPLPCAGLRDPADGADQPAGSGGRPRSRRRRLPDEAVRSRRAPRAHSRRPAHARR